MAVREIGVGEEELWWLNDFRRCIFLCKEFSVEVLMFVRRQVIR